MMNLKIERFHIAVKYGRFENSIGQYGLKISDEISRSINGSLNLGIAQEVGGKIILERDIRTAQSDLEMEATIATVLFERKVGIELACYLLEEAGLKPASIFDLAAFGRYFLEKAGKISQYGLSEPEMVGAGNIYWYDRRRHPLDIEKSFPVLVLNEKRIRLSRVDYRWEFFLAVPIE